MLMTTQEFRTEAGLGDWTIEGDKIKAVQDALTAYHQPGSKNAKRLRLGALDRAVQAWRKAHTPSNNLTHKSRERGKRRAMDELHWQVEATLVDEGRSLVMDLNAFRTLAGLGKWTVEGDKIKAVQTKLTRYHNALDANAQSTALRKLQTAISTWRAEHVAPLDLSDRSAKKMRAMDKLQWQVAILTNELINETPEALDDPDDIATHLRKRVLVVHETGDSTGTKLRQLLGMLASHYSDYIQRHHNDPRTSAVRIATVDIETWDLMRLLKDKCPHGSDGLDDGTNEPPVMSFDPGMQVVLLAYLKSLLSDELRERAEVALAAAGLGDKHCAQILVDYYFARDKDQISLHKDTYGTTLFVALHYLNMGEMTGPEFIFDRWPIAARDDYNHNGVVIDQEAWVNDLDEKARRPRAPWSRNAKYTGYGVDGAFEGQRAADGAATHFWPHQLIASLEEARGGLPRDTSVQMSELPPYGLISFVDELIYHSTPLTRRRDDEDTGQMSGYHMVTTGQNFYVGVAGDEKTSMKLKRRMSKAFRGGDFEPKTGFKDKRTFLRLWITISPKSWYTPWTRWKKR